MLVCPFAPLGRRAVCVHRIGQPVHSADGPPDGMVRGQLRRWASSVLPFIFVRPAVRRVRLAGIFTTGKLALQAVQVGLG